MAKDSKVKKASNNGSTHAPKGHKKATRQGNGKHSRPKRGRKAYRGQGR